MPRVNPPQDHGITGICLPTGEIIDFNRVRSFSYNPAIAALRFSFTIDRYSPVGIDTLTGRVRGVQKDEGRSAVIAHRFFRHNDTLYVQDADVKVIQS